MKRFPSGGTVNAVYRLGDAMAVRLPLVKDEALDVLTERKWLPRLALRLPVAIPEVLGTGEPAEGYRPGLMGHHPTAGRRGKQLLFRAA